MPAVQRDRRGGRVSAALIISVAAAALTLCWVVAAVLMSGRGLDVSDESLYLLSYRWWDVDLRSFSGVQYLYGPVFDLLDHSVRGLRLFRLVTLLGSHAVLGWAFMTWLRTQRPDATPSRQWETAGTLVIVASGGIAYGWLPLSPGYNDAALIGSLLTAAIVLRSLRAAHLHGRLPVLPALALGPVVLAQLLAKWSSAGSTVPFLALVAVLGFRSCRARGWLRYAGAAVLSLLASAAFVNFVVMPFRDLVPPMVEVNRLVASSSNSPVQLLRFYASTGAHMLRDASPIALIAVVTGAGGYLLVRRGLRLLGLALVWLAPVTAVVAVHPARGGLPGGGVAHIPQYAATLVALALAVTAALLARLLLRGLRPAEEPTTPPAGEEALPRQRRPTPYALVVVMLLSLPAIQALGTGNPVHFMAVNAFACWVALFIAAVTALPAGSALRAFAAAATACAVVVCVDVGADGLLVNPYRASGYADSTVRVGGDGTGASMLVSPDEAAYFAELRDLVGNDATPGRAMMAFDGKPGIILVLGGRSVGEAWYSVNQVRTAANIRAACADGAPWPDDAKPVIFYTRPDSNRDRRALRACGLHFRPDYKLAGILHLAAEYVRVYVPDQRSPGQ